MKACATNANWRRIGGHVAALILLGTAPLGCSLFGEDDGDNVCEGRSNQVVETTQERCEASGGEWLSEGGCYCFAGE